MYYIRLSKIYYIYINGKTDFCLGLIVLFFF